MAAALDKQIKKKPKNIGKLSATCPTCGGKISTIVKKNYCKCGQALKWED